MSNYTKNPERHKKATIEGRKRLKKWVRTFKLGKKCKKCKIECIPKYVKKFEFHHRNPKTKFMDVSTMVSKTYGKEMILKEIKKCILLCKECHDMITHPP